MPNIAFSDVRVKTLKPRQSPSTFATQSSVALASGCCHRVSSAPSHAQHRGERARTGTHRST